MIPWSKIISDLFKDQSLNCTTKFSILIFKIISYKKDEWNVNKIKKVQRQNKERMQRILRFKTKFKIKQIMLHFN